MPFLRWLLVNLIAISSVTSKGVFDSIMSPTFMQPLTNSSAFKSEDLFGDFFGEKTQNPNDSFASLTNAMMKGGQDLTSFNTSAVVPMSRSSSSSRVMSSYSHTDSESVSNYPPQTDTQGVNVTKVVENVQVVMPRSASSTFQQFETSVSSDSGSSLFGFNGQLAENALHGKLATEKPQTLKELTDLLSKVHPAGQYFVVFPVKTSDTAVASTFYVVDNTLPATVLYTTVGKLLDTRTTG